MPGITADAVELARLTVDRAANTALKGEPVDPAGPSIVLLLAEIAIRLQHIERTLEEAKLGL